MSVEDGLLNYRPGRLATAAATLRLDNDTFDAVLDGRVKFEEAVLRRLIKVEGDAAAAGEFFSLCETFAPNFNIVTP